MLVVVAVFCDAWALLYSGQRYLMIHADDAGLCAAVNEATIQAMEDGVVSSASIMVVCSGFDEIADYATAHPEKDFGVHLVLTCDASDMEWGPILKDNVPSLIQRNGVFWRNSEDVAANAKLEDVDRELRAQVQRALDRGIKVSHLDHHMWVLTQRPEFFAIYVKLSRDFKIPIRLHRYFASKEFGESMQDENAYHSIIEPLIRSGYPMFDFIETRNYQVPAPQKLKYYLNVLQRLEPGISEVVIHCSVNRPGMLLPGAAERREADFAAFTSAEIANEIQRLNIKLVNWKDMVKMTSPIRF